jgi:hypothetical protein
VDGSSWENIDDDLANHTVVAGADSLQGRRRHGYRVEMNPRAGPG